MEKCRSGVQRGPDRSEGSSSADTGPGPGGGLIGGLAIGIAVGCLLVAMFRGIFDPASDGLTVPWPFVTLLIVSVTAIGLLVLSP